MAIKVKIPKSSTIKATKQNSEVSKRVDDTPAPTGQIDVVPVKECHPKVITVIDNSTRGVALDSSQRDRILDYKIQEEIKRALAAELNLQTQIDDLEDWEDELINTEVIQDILADLSTKLNIKSNRYVKVITNPYDILSHMDNYNFDEDKPAEDDYGDVVFNKADENYYRLISRNPFAWKKYEIDWSQVPGLYELIEEYIEQIADIRDVLFVEDSDDVDVSDVREGGAVILTKNITRINLERISKNFMSNFLSNNIASSTITSFSLGYSTPQEDNHDEEKQSVTKSSYAMSFSSQEDTEKSLLGYSEEPTQKSNYAMSFSSDNNSEQISYSLNVSK